MIMIKSILTPLNWCLELIQPPPLPLPLGHYALISRRIGTLLATGTRSGGVETIPHHLVETFSLSVRQLVRHPHHHGRPPLLLLQVVQIVSLFIGVEGLQLLKIMIAVPFGEPPRMSNWMQMA